MNRARQSFETDVAKLLTLLEDVLSPNQLWELELHFEHEEYEFGFELLRELLHGVDQATLPTSASELFASLARELGVDDALWRGVGRKKET